MRVDRRKTSVVTTVAFLFALPGFPVGNASGGAPPPQVFPLGARTASLGVQGAASSADPRAAAVATALRTLNRRLDARDANAPTPAQAIAAAALRRRVRDGVELHWRMPHGTPRMIRGAELEPAAGGARATADADGDTARAFLRHNTDLLRLHDPDGELTLASRRRDELGRRQFRFTQRYRGLPVWPAEVIVHLDRGGAVDAMDGAFVATPDAIDPTPQRTAADAVRVARAAVEQGTGMDAVEAGLIVYAPQDAAPRLAWRVRLARGLDERWLVVVGDHDGATLSVVDETLETDVAGSGNDLFGTNRALHVWAEGGVDYLVDTSKPMYDGGSDPPGADTTRGGIVVLDANHQDGSGTLSLAQVTSSNAAGPWLADGVSAAFGLAQTYDYYLDKHGRNSLDGLGGTMLGVVRFGSNFQNAFWNGQLMVFGDAQPYAGALDVVAHELTHGVTQHSANLQYQNQSGALNEAMSDIFGEATEARTLGQNDWLLGASLGAPLRNMLDPHAITIGGTNRPYPDRLSELIAPNDAFLAGFKNRDNGGVHINSSIINHAFYELAAGLPGAIGIDDAAKVFYRALTSHLVASSQFVDARLAAVQSAQELFGLSDPRVQRVRDAFDAVEIFDGNGTPDPGTFPGTDGDDATLFLFSDGQPSPSSFLGRREAAQGDGAAGSPLGSHAVQARRPSVRGDGARAAYVTLDYDVCFLDTNDPASEVCAGIAGQVNSITLSPDGSLAGVVLRSNGQPLAQIDVIELTGAGTTHTYPLRAPAVDAGGFDTVQYASGMDFTADNRLLVYDAYNVISLANGGGEVTAWSIFALDVAADVTYVVVQPTAGVDIGNPALAQRSDDRFTFEVQSQDTHDSTVFTGVLSTGDVTPIGVVPGNVGAPGYNGDDTALVYTTPDAGAPSGGKLVQQPLAADGITPVGAVATLLDDAFFGVVYRRGTFNGPTTTTTTLPPRCFGDASCDDGDPCTADTCVPDTGCDNSPLLGGAALACLFPSTAVASACAADPGGARIAARLDAAAGKFQRAAVALKVKKERTLVKQGVSLLGKGLKLARKLGRKGQLSTGCVDAVTAFVGEVKSRR